MNDLTPSAEIPPSEIPPAPAPLPPEQPPAPPAQPPVEEPPGLPEPAPIQEPPGAPAPALALTPMQEAQQQVLPTPSEQQQAYKQGALQATPAMQTPLARYSVIHQTDYSYQSPVALSQQYLHLSPRNFAYQQTVSHQIQVDPAPEDSGDALDYFANATKKLTVTVPHQMLIVRAESVVDVYPRPTLEQLAGGAPWEDLQASMRQSVGAPDLDPYQYLYNSPHIQCNAALRDYAQPSFTPDRPLLEAAFDLTCRITDDFQFDPDATNIHTTLDEVMQGRRGVCQDFAHMMIGCLRALGLPARYVSGYILTHPPEGQARLIGADASHAWASLWSPVFGWVDFDPTNRCLVQHEHITLGWGRDYSDVTPLRGIVLGGGSQLLGVSVTVTPLTQGQHNLI